MNFENMPELTWKYGYFMALFMMVFISVFIFIWFRKRKII
jgi:magnesium transporter